MLRVTVSGGAEYRADLLAAEEPLEIRVNGTPLTVTMRTPGDDIDLAAQKAIMVGLPVLAAVSAPSSLAASLAEETGLTLVGFLRGATMNVYAGTQRVTADVSAALAAPVDSGA